AQENSADSALALSHEDRPQRALADGEADLCPGPPGAIGRRGHPQYLLRLSVEAAVGVVARLVNRGRHRGAPTELGSNPLTPVGSRIVSRGEAREGLEHPVKVERTHPRLGRQFLEGGWIRRSLDPPAGLGHLGRVLLDQRGLIRLAAPAGPEPGSLRVLASEVKPDVLRSGPPGRTGRTAIHAGSPDR